MRKSHLRRMLPSRDESLFIYLKCVGINSQGSSVLALFYLGNHTHLCSGATPKALNYYLVKLENKLRPASCKACAHSIENSVQFLEMLLF